MYTSITELTPADHTLENPELKALRQVWSERREELQESDGFKQFLVKLQREWAIETGIIERLYNWDRGVTEVLIEQGIDAALIAHKNGVNRDTAENTYQMVKDQLGIIEGLFPYVKSEQPLTEHFIRGLQAQFTAHQQTTTAVNGSGNQLLVRIQRGEYKPLPNNPRRADGGLHEYCPPLLVKEEMERLLGWYQEYENPSAPELVSAWLHHRFTHIHPFQDGNGRVARTLASLVFLKSAMFPVVIRDADRKEYIASLESADAGNLGPLVALFVKRQKNAILTAIGLEQQVQQQRVAKEAIDESIASVLSLLSDRYSAKNREAESGYTVAESLHQRAADHIRQFCAPLEAKLPQLTPPDWNDNPYYLNIKAEGNDSDKKHYYYGQIIETAKKLDYYANLSGYRSWVRLLISTEHFFEFVISLHGYGPARNRVFAVSGFTFQRMRDEERGFGSGFVNTRPCVMEVFQFNYAEPAASIGNRFDDWLESACAMALSEWERSI